MAKVTINPNIPGGGQAPNVHPMKGIAYGTICGNKVPALMEHIFEHGENITITEREEELKQQIRQALQDAKHEHDDEVCGIRDKIRDTIAGAFPPSIGDDIFDLAVALEPEVDEAEIIQAIMEDETFDEPAYRLEEDGFIYEMSYLGGAPLIFVLDAPIVTFAHICSPCCPNAGDLGTPADFETAENPMTGATVCSPLSGICCFAVGPEWIDGEMPYKIRHIDEEGNVTGDWQ